MEILIPDSWLRVFLETAATPKQIMDFLSLCGPSVEKTEKIENEIVYLIEITTNRVDTASIYGIAREAYAILPRFGIKTRLQSIEIKTDRKKSEVVDYIQPIVDFNLCPRFSCILIKDVKIKNSPGWMQKRLKEAGMRPINNIVDISNYIMQELGQPVHTFDYDKISRGKMILRKSKKGERITTLDGKEHILPGEDIIIEDGEGRLIDLAGIMGGLNSAVDKNTKNVLLFVQNYNPSNIRRTSMALAHRTQAAALFEKGVDPELVSLAIKRGIDLFVDLCDGHPADKILDLYPEPFKGKVVRTNINFINRILGKSIPNKEISNILNSLGFETKWLKDDLEISVPSWRSRDIDIAEDIVEEIARIYGYFNLPSEIMTGKIPEKTDDYIFDFEYKLKQLLSGWGGCEIYTLSLVSKKDANFGNGQPLRIKNPLGKETEYLRTSLAPSLIAAAKLNSSERKPFHLFEVGNVYLEIRNNLPEERLKIAGVFVNYAWRQAKGIIEAFLDKLNINIVFEIKNSPFFYPNSRLSIKYKNIELGIFGKLDENLIYYEFDLDLLRKFSKPFKKFKPLPKYPPQIEDLSLIFPAGLLTGNVIEEIKNSDKQIKAVELIDIYENVKTFRITYQNSNKTLTDKEIREIREGFLKKIQNKFKVKIK